MYNCGLDNEYCESANCAMLSEASLWLVDTIGTYHTWGFAKRRLQIWTIYSWTIKMFNSLEWVQLIQGVSSIYTKFQFDSLSGNIGYKFWPQICLVHVCDTYNKYHFFSIANFDVNKVSYWEFPKSKELVVVAHSLTRIWSLKVGITQPKAFNQIQGSLTSWFLSSIIRGGEVVHKRQMRTRKWDFYKI